MYVCSQGCLPSAADLGGPMLRGVRVLWTLLAGMNRHSERTPGVLRCHVGAVLHGDGAVRGVRRVRLNLQNYCFTAFFLGPRVLSQDWMRGQLSGYSSCPGC